ncbi:MAG: T9SS type A sorting domain-containing protein [Ignavibacteriales bacterium]|nr:T9SS type A sorting domain-containing protein [Ignavibacteriales bacterium]
MKQSKQILTSLVAVILFLLVLPQSAYSQTYIDVAPGFSTLNDAVVANTNPDVIFRLQRGPDAIYLLNGSITANIPLRIEAVPGTGSRPQLIPGLGSGGVSDIPLRAKANVTLNGVYLTSKDEGGAYLSQIIRVQADGVRLKLNDCFLENSAQSAIRTDNKNSKIYLTGSTFRNCASDWANGRGIDDRGVAMDTLYLENNTIYNIASRFLRDGGGYINYVYVNHNTFANMGIRVMDIGECPTVIFKNNLIYNCGFLGKGKSSTDALLLLSPLTNTVFAGVTQSVEVHNNNFYLSPEIVAVYSDTVIAKPSYNAQMNSAIGLSGTGGNTISEGVSFTLAPIASNTAVLASLYWADPALDNGTTATGLRTTGTFNFAYPTTALSYTAGTSNQPLGALTWFGIAVGVKDNITTIPTGYELSANYPNPFNPSTTIHFALPERAQVKLVVFNSLGQIVASLVNETKESGSYSVVWNGKSEHGFIVPSGIYFYRIDAGNFSSTHKMVLLK